MSVILDFDITMQEGQLARTALGLHEASARGDLDAVSGWLESAVNVDDFSPAGWAPLHLAAFFGHIRAAELLLNSGAQPNIRSRQPGTCDGCTPLHAAVISGHSAVALLLISAGAKVNDRDEAGYTPLHLATSIGHLGLVKHLLMARCDINPLTGDETPLGLAIRARHMEIAALLRQCGGSN